MKFRSEIKIESSEDFKLDPTVRCALVGSCFTQNMARCMRSSLWLGVDPFGALYNPASIRILLENVIQEEDRAIEQSLFNSDGIWHSWLLDSSFSADTPVEVMDNYHHAALQLRQALEQGRQLIVTFGTAWVYSLVGADPYIVANCHKQPSSLFERYRLTVDQIVEEWQRFITVLAARYPDIKIVFTVSPVRHLKDGFIGNTVSKSILHLAVERLTELFDFVTTFPAYEILMDDLRDYRFYSGDLVHPSEEAVLYVWDKFLDQYVTDSGKAILSKGRSLSAALSHRPIVKTPLTIRRDEVRLGKLDREISEFMKSHPGMLDPR